MKPLLIVIDIQKGWVHPTATAEVMTKCVELCSDFPGDVIHCCFKNTPGSIFETELNWTRFKERDDTDQMPEIASLQLPIYWRDTYSCLTEEVKKIVNQYERVYIAGVFTDASVYATAVDIFDQGIPVTVIKDHVATLHGERVHDAALSALGHIIGRQNVLSASELLER